VPPPSQEPIYSSIPDPFLEIQLDSSIPDPFLETQPNSNVLSEEPLPEEEWQMLQSFHKQLDNDTMEECNVCLEKWFNIGVRGGICARCRRRDKKRAEDEPDLFSKENFMDPGSVPGHLQPLTQVEEQLIARVHVHIEVRQVRG
jgi:hypothetical protein